MDEALAYSDAENEYLIQEVIQNLVKSKTVLIVAHRLQSIMGANKIVVLSKGKIIEHGKHEDLIARDAEYKALWDLQHEADTWQLPRTERLDSCERHY